MDRSELFQAATLWFVAAIFLRVGPGDPEGLVLTLAGFVALALPYLVPIYLLVSLGVTVRAK